MALCLLTPTVHAQPEPTADELFQQGMQAYEAGDFARACVLIERSLKIDKGMAAQFRLGECYEKLGKRREAWQQYREVERAAKKEGLTERAEVAAQRAAAVEAKLGKIAIKVPPEVRAIAGLTIERDGQPVPESEWEEAVVLEPGNHTVTVTAPGRRAFSATIESKPGETSLVHVPPLAEDAPDAPPEPPAKVESSSQGTIGLVVGGIGVGVFAVGGILGLVANGKHGDSDAHCRDSGICDSEGILIRADARKIGVTGTALVAIGGAAVITGGIVWLTAPDDPEEAAQNTRVRIGPTGISLEGSF